MTNWEAPYGMEPPPRRYPITGGSQVYYPYWELEEHKAGMWRAVYGDERHTFSQAAAELMRRPADFRAAMLRAVKEWPKSCEMAMTTPGLNQRAWMGHAGCCIGTGSPEDLTRLGWHMLTREEQDVANRMADEAISEWHRQHLHADNLPLF